MISTPSVHRRLTTLIPLLLIIGMIAVSIVGLINLNGNLLADRKEKSKAIVEATISGITKLYDRAKSGEISEEEAKNLALMLVSDLRFEKNNYVWINDLEGIVIAHPRLPIGQSQKNIKDDVGVEFGTIILETAQSGGGFVNYYWRRGDGDTPAPKVSYVAPFKPWKWIIGSGIYMEDVEAVFFRNAVITGAVSLIIILIVWAGTNALSRSVYTPLSEITKAMEGYASGDKTVFTPYTKERDEIGDLARAIEKFRNKNSAKDNNTQLGSNKDSFPTSVKESKQSIDPFT